MADFQRFTFELIDALGDEGFLRQDVTAAEALPDEINCLRVRAGIDPKRSLVRPRPDLQPESVSLNGEHQVLLMEFFSGEFLTILLQSHGRPNALKQLVGRF